MSENKTQKVYRKVMHPQKVIFAREYLLHGNAQKAYRVAKGKEIGHYANPHANRWAHEDPDIQEIMRIMQAEIFEMNKVTLDGHLDKLEEIRDLSVEAGKFAVALNAEIARGKVAGLYVEKRELTVNATEMSTDQIKAELARLGEEHKVIDLDPDRFRTVEHLKLVDKSGQ